MRGVSRSARAGASTISCEPWLRLAQNWYSCSLLNGGQVSQNATQSTHSTAAAHLLPPRARSFGWPSLRWKRSQGEACAAAACIGTRTCGMLVGSTAGVLCSLSAQGHWEVRSDLVTSADETMRSNTTHESCCRTTSCAHQQIEAQVDVPNGRWVANAYQEHQC